MKEDPAPDDEARAILMATENLYEQWEKRIKAEGLTEGLAKGRTEGGVGMLEAAYHARFGAVPAALRKALPKVFDPAQADLWMGLFVTASAKEIAAAVRKGQPTR